MNRTLTVLATMVVAGGAAIASPAAAAPVRAPGTPAQHTPATAGDPSTPAPGMSPEMTAAMRRDLHLTAEGARARLAVEAAARVQQRSAHKALGSAFGGAWLTADGTALVVGVTDASRADEVRATGARPQVVARSAAALDADKARLDRRAGSAGKAVQSWYVDPASNSVVVRARTKAAADAFARTSGVSAVLVELSDDAHAYRTVGDLRGGDEWNAEIGNGYISICSIGFAVSGGFVSAGHCATAGQSTLEGGARQGTVMASTFPNHDWLWVQSNQDWASRPVVNNYSGGTVSVGGSQEAVVGASVCRSGRTTGWRCGVVRTRNMTVNYKDGTVYGLTDTTACAQPGDSGGSFLSGDQAQGVTSGAAGDCSTGGTSSFQPVNPILSTYNLKLVTTGNTSRLVNNMSGRCLDVPNGAPADGTQLQIWDCNPSAAQQWTFGDDGTLRSRGMCMDVAWGSTADGAVVQLAKCSGNPAQQWVLSGAGDLVNPQANKCVDVKDWNSAAGTKLVTWTCHGGSNQKWYRG